MNERIALAVGGILLAHGALACSEDDPPACEDVAAEALRTCVADHSATLAACYAADGAACGDEEALQALQNTVEGSCADGELGRTVAASVGRLRNACSSESSSLAWRSFGGPQGAAWEKASGGDRDCLSEAHAAGADLVEGSLAAIDTCLAGGACDVEAERERLAGAAQERIEGACDDLGALVAVDPEVFVERAARQVDCLASSAHADVGDLALRCGPSHAQFEAPRGEWAVIQVDGDEWGTLCSDGSGYAFHIRLAPEGERLDRFVIGLQGGGVCLFEDDCTAKMASSPDLFTAQDDEPLISGIMSSDPDESPFANWTKVYLPYCTQDVFAGGGVVEELGPGVELPRYGSVNMRAAMQMVRDVVWKMVDAETDEGFRSDDVVALFGGFSAGGYGTLYNYHWFLDDLLWPRTAAFPDAGLGLDNGETLGVRGLGLVKIPVWGTRPFLPPYCFAGDCAVGAVGFEAISPRLKTVPEQQVLAVTNPFDETQQNDAFFMDTPSFINALRSTYCDTKDLPGIHYYITSTSDESVHVVSPRPEHWTGTIDGEVMRDWFGGAIASPDDVVDRAEEADFVSVFAGVEPYPCTVAP